MKVYVTYVLADYTTALGLSTKKATAEKYAKELRERGCDKVWVDAVEVNEHLTELDCD